MEGLKKMRTKKEEGSLKKKKMNPTKEATAKMGKTEYFFWCFVDNVTACKKLIDITSFERSPPPQKKDTFT